MSCPWCNAIPSRPGKFCPQCGAPLADGIPVGNFTSGYRLHRRYIVRKGLGSGGMGTVQHHARQERPDQADRFRDRAYVQAGKAQDTQLYGTPGYMPPE